MQPFLIFADDFYHAQTADLSHNAKIHQSVLHIEFGRTLPATAVKSAIGHDHHQYIFIKGAPVIKDKVRLLTHRTEKSCDKGKDIGAAAGDEGQSLVMNHIFTDIRVQPSTAQVGRPLIIKAYEVDGVLLGSDLCFQIGKGAVRKAAHKVVAGAAGHNPHGNIGAAGKPLKHLVHGAIAAAAVKAQMLPIGGGTAFPYKAGGVSRTGGQINFQLILSPGKKGAQMRLQAVCRIRFAGGRIDDENVFHVGKAPSMLGVGQLPYHGGVGQRLKAQ